MIDAHALKELIEPLVNIESSENSITVSTHCLYPSNSTVSVVVRTQMDGYVVSDNGGAIEEAVSSGLRISDLDRRLKHVVKNQGLLVKDGVIHSPRVPVHALPAVILLVANASKDTANWILENIKFETPRNFKKDVADLLSRYFNDNMKNNDVIVGDSNKPYHFGHVIYLSGKRKLIIDPVMNDASSISSRVLANLDVAKLNDNSIIQRLVYDDYARWKSSDLKILEMGATPIPFSRAEREIERLAA